MIISIVSGDILYEAPRNQGTAASNNQSEGNSLWFLSSDVRGIASLIGLNPTLIII